jgi:hypothetical protein
MDVNPPDGPVDADAGGEVVDDAGAGSEAVDRT